MVSNMRLPHLLEMILTASEGLAIIVACLWPVGLTMEFLTGRRMPWGVGGFLVGLAVLAIATAIRRDARRLLYLLGPCALSAYSGLLVVVGGSALRKQDTGGRVFAVGALAAIVFVLTLHWIQRTARDQRQPQRQ
jgi:arginine exporter protein ArgO